MNRVPSGSSWHLNQYSVETWLQRALRKHPWRTRTTGADLIFISFNFSLLCLNGHFYLFGAVWSHLSSGLDENYPNSSKAITLQYGHCAAPWRLPNQRPRSRRLIALHDRLPRATATAHQAQEGPAVVSPFVVASPEWLVARNGPSHPLVPTVDWADRKLLFFAGHIPKLYISPTRYKIWSALRKASVERSGALLRHLHSDSITLASSSLLCTVGAYRVCRMKESELRKKPNSFFLTYCLADCANMSSGASSCGGMREWQSEETNALRLIRACQSYKRVDFDAELQDMITTTRTLSHGDYLAQAMSHRFCIVAPGDFISTKKLTESMAIGGKGGCIPVIVLPSGDAAPAASAARLLPYARWLDYCEAVYFVSEKTATTRMESVLRALAKVDAHTAAKKHRALREVADAFVFREHSHSEQPSAPEFILAEMCHAAKWSKRRIDSPGLLSGRLVSGVPDRCLLLPKR